MRSLLFLICLFAPVAALAEIVVPSRTIRAREIIGAEDIMLKQVSVAGALSDPHQVIGLEARIALYPGRPVRHGDVGPPALVERNDLVALVFNTGGLKITTEGRVLGRGAAGETVRVMNLSSRATLTGTIRPDGSIEVK